MRLHLTVQRHGLPVTRILWTTSPPSLFGHNLPSPSSMIPATTSAITSSRVPNALYANGGYTIAQLLEDVNEVIPLETEPQLFEDQSSGQWGLEDYVVEVGGSECLHFMELDGLLRDGDEVLIRALQISDLRARRLSGRHQISADGKHLIDGVPFGKPFLKRPTSSRPAITIPPRKKRRTALALWGSGSTYEEEDTDLAPSRHISTGKELSLLKPESEHEKEGEDIYEDAYHDDYEDYHEPNEDGDGTVIRHNIDKEDQDSESDNDASDVEAEDLSQELQDLKEDIEISVLPEEEMAPRRRIRPSIHDVAPRKSSLAPYPARRDSEGGSSRRDSKSVTFEERKQESSVSKVQTSIARTMSTSDESADPVFSESDSNSSVSDSSESESNEDDSSSDESSAAEATSESTSELEEEDSDSSSDSSASESKDEQEVVPKADTVSKPSHSVNPPGAGSQRTKKSNQRTKMRRRLTRLKELGILEDNADFAALRDWDAKHGDSSYIPETATMTTTATDPNKQEQEEFEVKRQRLLRDLQIGGVDVSPFVSEKENISPHSDWRDASELPEDHDELYETANDTNEASPEVPQRRTLDVASTRRLLFGSLGVRTPRSKEEEEATRKKLAGKVQKPAAQQTVQDAAESHESEPEVDWREKLILGASECVYDDVELSTPPFPFEQHWDTEAGNIIRQRKGWGKKRKRRQQLQVYDEAEGFDDDGYVNDGVRLNYDDDGAQVENDESHLEESEPTAAKPVEDIGDDLPTLPSDLSGLPDLTGKDMKSGLVFAFKQLDLSKATNWQPAVSDYRVAVVTDVSASDNNILSIRLAKPYRRLPRVVVDEDGPFQYSGFEMPGVDDEEDEDDGSREVPFDDLFEPKLLRAAPAADAGAENTASLFPADDILPAREPSQTAINIQATSDWHEDDQQLAAPSQRPQSPTDSHVSTPNSIIRDDNPVQSPRSEGFELSHSNSSPLSSSISPSAASFRFSRHVKDDSPSSPHRNDTVQPSLEPTCTPSAYDHGPQESGLTDQLQTISSPRSVGSYNRLMNYFLSQDPPSPMKSERKSSPVEPDSQGPGSPTVPNPFYEMDKAHEERRQRAHTRAQRDRSYDRATSRQQSPEVKVPSTTESTRKSSPRSSSHDPSPVSVVPDSILPNARDAYPPASQMAEYIVDLTQSSAPVSPGGSDEDYADSHWLPRGAGWVQKNLPRPRRQTRSSSAFHGVIRTLEDVSRSPPRLKRGRKS